MTRSNWYTLDEAGQPVPAATSKELITWLRDHPHAIELASDKVDGYILISTIFTGVDATRLLGGPPKLWQTQVFGAGTLLDIHIWNYTSSAEARAGHARIIEAVRRAVEKRRAVR